MSRRYLSPLLGAIAAFSLALGGTAWASTSSVGVLQQVSGATPFAGCTADTVAAHPGTVYPNSEVEPWIAASRTDRNGDGAADIIGGYQQDRWSNGASRGVYGSVWYHGAWVQVSVPGTSACVGGTHLRPLIRG